jgi:hypothetical protein
MAEPGILIDAIDRVAAVARRRGATITFREPAVAESVDDFCRPAVAIPFPGWSIEGIIRVGRIAFAGEPAKSRPRASMPPLVNPTPAGR